MCMHFLPLHCIDFVGGRGINILFPVVFLLQNFFHNFVKCKDKNSVTFFSFTIQFKNIYIHFELYMREMNVKEGKWQVNWGTKDPLVFSSNGAKVCRLISCSVSISFSTFPESFEVTLQIIMKDSIKSYVHILEHSYIIND